MQQQEDELRLQQHARAIEIEIKKAEADGIQNRIEIELTIGGSRIFGLQVNDLESVGSRKVLG